MSIRVEIGKAELQKITPPFIPKKSEDLLYLAQKENRKIKKLDRKNHLPKDVEIKVESKDPYLLILFRDGVYRPYELAGLKLPCQEIKKI